MGRSRRRRRQVTLALFCALVGTAIATLGTATALASAPPTGNAEAISFVRSSSHAVNHTDGYQYTQTGFVAMSSAYGRGGATFNWSWGTSAAEPLPSGYTEATEHATIALRGGRIAWVSDDLTATAPITNCTYCLPFDIVLTHSGLVGHFTSIAYTCSFHLGSTPSPWKVGELAGPGPSGDFQPLVHQGGNVLVTSSELKGSRMWTTTETLSTRTHLPSAISTSIAAGPSPGEPAFSFSTKIHFLSHTPTAPHITLCKK